VLKKAGLPVTLKMRHDAHYIEQLTSFSGAAVGRMIRVDQIRPNPEQPRKALGDLGELTESVRAKGVLEPLLVRFVPTEVCAKFLVSRRRWTMRRHWKLRSSKTSSEKT
jgi:ParB family transcriptional regulator, chromosome partitioning protein